MNYWQLIITIVVADLLAVISPGPDFILTVKNSIKGGRTLGFITALGIASGISIHIIYSWIGVSVIITSFPWSLKILQWIGGLYLIWIGITSIKDKTEYKEINDFLDTKQKAANMKQAFLNGFITNLFNPKAALFFISLYSIVLKPNTPLWVHLTLAFCFIGVTLAWFSLVALFLNKPNFRKFFIKKQKYILFSSGIMLLGLGCKILFFS